MKKLLALFITSFALFSLAACGLFENDDITVEEGTTYTSIDINPSIEMILDEEGIVVTVSYLNEDAEIVAANLELIGLPFKEALEIYIDAAIEAGYIDVDSNENIITITNDDEAVEEDLKADVEAILAERAVGAAIFGGEMLEAYHALAEDYDISVGRARLISRAVEIDGELTFEEALELSQQEIMSILIAEHRANMETFIAERREAALAMQEEMREGAMERVEAHRADVDAGLIDAPDYDAIRADVEANIEAIRAAYQDRIEEALQEAKDRKDNHIPNN